ncbi:hypothetical protein, partial [Enterobacter cloacae]|uniref:hypothetical protein n=1 Tax=Enterobacter cloacae TaxID=550 RepID=UPI001952C707
RQGQCQKAENDQSPHCDQAPNRENNAPLAALVRMTAPEWVPRRAGSCRTTGQPTRKQDELMPAKPFQPADHSTVSAYMMA